MDSQTKRLLHTEGFESSIKAIIQELFNKAGMPLLRMVLWHPDGFALFERSAARLA